MKSETRYTIHRISDGERIGERISHARTFAEADESARAVAFDYHFGVCIVDHEKRTVDWGANLVTPLDA